MTRIDLRVGQSGYGGGTEAWQLLRNPLTVEGPRTDSGVPEMGREEGDSLLEKRQLEGPVHVPGRHRAGQLR